MAARRVTVAVTAGASAPEMLVEDVVNYLRQNGFSSVEEVEVMPENVRFGLPPEIVQAIGSPAARRPFQFAEFRAKLSVRPKESKVTLRSKDHVC